MTLTEEQHKALRAPFPAAAVGKLPKLTCKACSGRSCQEHKKAKCKACGNYISSAHIDLDYVGHAEVTDRLLTVDPAWTWEPCAFAEDGGPLVRRQGHEATLWIRLTVCGVTRIGVGSVASNVFDAEKQLIGDAIRNAAMRFGVALDLWSKNELESALIDDAEPPPHVDASTGEVRSQTLGGGPTINGPACATCGQAIGTEPVRKQAGQFVHITCPTPPAQAGAGDAVERPSAPSSPHGEAGGGPAPAAGPPPMSDPQRRNLMRLCNERGLSERQARLDWAADLIGRPLESFGSLTKDEAGLLIEAASAAPVAPSLLGVE